MKFSLQHLALGSVLRLAGLMTAVTMMIAYILYSLHISEKYVFEDTEEFGKQAITRLTLIAERSVGQDNPLLREVISHISADYRTDWILILDPGYVVTNSSHGKFIGQHLTDLKEVDQLMVAQLTDSGAMAISQVKTKKQTVFSLAFSWPSALGQLRGNDVGFVLINLDIGDSFGSARKKIFQEAAIMLTFYLLILFVMLSMIFRYLTSSLNKMREATEQYSSSNFDFRLPQLPVNEFNALGQSFNQMSQHIQQTLLRQEKSEEGLRILLENSPAGIISLDEKFKVIFVNKMFSKITGMNSKDLIGIDVKALDNRIRSICLSESEYSDMETELKSVINSSEWGQVNLTLEKNAKKTTTVKIRNRSLFVLERNAVLLDFKKAGVATSENQYIVYFTDVTIFSEIDRLKSEFITTAAHELRTPMTTVAGYSELLKFMPCDMAKSEKMNDLIYQQSKHILMVLDDMLNLAQLDASANLELDLRKLNVYRLLKQLIYSEHYMMLRNRIQLSSFDKNLVITADPQRILKPLQNVLDNALKFSPDDTVVQINAEQVNPSDEPGKISISIHDDGIGMDEEQCNQIFTRFYRADKSGKYLGTGLGLSLTKEILVLHKATIHVDSQLGKGTTVIITFLDDGRF